MPESSTVCLFLGCVGASLGAITAPYRSHQGTTQTHMFSTPQVRVIYFYTGEFVLRCAATCRAPLILPRADTREGDGTVSLKRYYHNCHYFYYSHGKEQPQGKSNRYSWTWAGGSFVIASQPATHTRPTRLTLCGQIGRRLVLMVNLRHHHRPAGGDT